MLVLQSFQGHLHHAHRAVHDLLAGGDDGIGLLPLQHHLRDFRGVGQVVDPRFRYRNPGRGDPFPYFVAERFGHFLYGGPQAGGLSLGQIIGVAGGQMTNGRFGLYLYVFDKVVHIETRLGCIFHAPDHDGRDLDRVAVFVVHLQSLAVEIPGSQGDLRLAVEGIHPPESLLPHRPRVFAEQRKHTGFVRFQREKSLEAESQHGEGRYEDKHQQEHVPDAHFLLQYGWIERDDPVHDH